jgi:hypothetical protein
MWQASGVVEPRLKFSGEFLVPPRPLTEASARWGVSLALWSLCAPAVKPPLPRLPRLLSLDQACEAARLQQVRVGSTWDSSSTRAAARAWANLLWPSVSGGSCSQGSFETVFELDASSSLPSAKPRVGWNLRPRRLSTLLSTSNSHASFTILFPTTTLTVPSGGS